ncbi:hypothetical protein ACIB24_00220 [Spongisporangium articulatum]|uniref:PASTA domain-containing protein n=1 Tax=Spongisporangium articulatum TaxID=3362603 RepID=A0ABW8AGI5_9ACTN
MRAWPVVVAVLVLAGCGSTQGGLGADGTAPAETAPAPASAAGGTSSGSSDGEKAQLPDLVGKGLQVAQDDAQAAGFDRLTSHDALGRGRSQLWDRDWQVCFQSPAAGQRPTDTEIDFGTVKLDEKCPKSDGGAGEVEKAGDTMPDLIGTSLNIAQESLGDNVSLSVTDGKNRHRPILVLSNWQVCTQKPKPGGKFGGVPVSLTVVKFDEKC